MIEQRRALGLDGHDEVWDGIYRVTPHAGLWHAAVQTRLGAVLDRIAAPLGLAVTAEFNIGVKADHRIPDLGVHRSLPDETYVPTAAMVVEVLSPDDDSFKKFDFYAEHGVDEIMVADPVERTIRIWVLQPSLSFFKGATTPRRPAAYGETDFSVLLSTYTPDLVAAVNWPAA